MRIGAKVFGLGFAFTLLLLAPDRGAAQGLGLLNSKDDDKPISIEADQGIEWQQNNHLYIARGNTKATRGDTTVYADTLTAYYRPIAKKTEVGAVKAEAEKDKNAAAPAKKKKAKTAGSGGSAAADSNNRISDPMGDESTEVYRIVADGHVRIVTSTEKIWGDHAVYDVDQALAVMTGKDLKLETKQDVVTARDSLEWYDKKQLAVARGDAVAVREGKRLRGDVLTAEVVKTKQDASHISRIDAQGNVLVSSQDQIARGDSGVYNVDTGMATLAGRVTLTRAENELRGQYAVVDLNNNVSRLLSAPPSAKLTGDSPPRVQGLLVPEKKPAKPK